MYYTTSTANSQASYSGRSAEVSVGVIPDFHHVPANSAVALDSYIHLYLESTALAESLFKASVERRAS
jgi:hypothetical protein